MSRFRSLLRTRALALFAIDHRALALFRVALAVLLLVDLASRAWLLSVNYTDAGAHPRSAALTYYDPGALPSLYMFGGSTWFAAALFGIAAVTAGMLGLGWWTRSATLVSWVLHYSLVARHALLNDGGDYLLSCLLFWSLFVPLGARWSLAARRRAPPASPFAFDAASAALLLQVGCVFLVTGLAKTGPEWADGSAIQYAIHRRWWILPFGEWLLAHPAVPRLLTPAVRWYEILGGLALFLPFRTAAVRCLAVPGFWGLLAGLGLGLRLNLFPWITGCGLLLFLPSKVWDALERRVPALRPSRVGPHASPGRPRARGERPVQAAVLALLGVILWINAGNAYRALRPPQAVRRIGGFLHLSQGWFMYAPSPRHVDVWLEHRGRLQSRALIELDGVDGGDGWRTVQHAWRDYRFQYFLQKQTLRKWRALNADYARWLCRRWNRDHAGPEHLESVTVTAVAEKIVLQGEAPEPIGRRTLASLACPP